jgi:hypothetical protein
MPPSEARRFWALPSSKASLVQRFPARVFFIFMKIGQRSAAYQSIIEYAFFA